MQPWGLSGSEFLAVYSAAFVASVLLVVVPRRWFGSRATGRLTPYQAAFLLGGTGRVLLTGCYDLLAGGRVHRSRDGQLTKERGFTAPDPLQAAVAKVMAVPAEWSQRVAKLDREPAIEDLKAQLRASDLLMAPAATRWWLLALFLPVAVWIVGLVRVIDGVIRHEPMAELIMLLVASAIAVPLLYRSIRYRGVLATPKGAALVGQLRRRHDAARKADGARSGADLELTAIALLGLAAGGLGVRSLVGVAAATRHAGLGIPGGGWMGAPLGGGYGSDGGHCGGVDGHDAGCGGWQY